MICFFFRIHIQKTGKKAGTKRVLVSLIQEPYTFRRKRDPKNGKVYFCCCACENDGRILIATANKIIKDEDDEEKDEYELVKVPACDDHVCAPSGTEILKKNCVRRMEEIL